jgi:prophage tail gpP-like protein
MTITVKQKYNYAADIKTQAAVSKVERSAAYLAAKTMEGLFKTDDKHKFRLVVNNVPIDEVISGSLKVSIDSAARGWTAVVPFDPSAPMSEFFANRAALFKPFQYLWAAVYLGGSLQCFGILFGVRPSINDAGRHLILSGWSNTANAIDSDMLPPYEVNNITLQKHAKNLLTPFGIEVVWSGGVDKPFKRVTANKTDKTMDHLISLAKQRNLLVTCDADGKVNIHEVGGGFSLVTIEEGKPPFRELEFDLDGRKRFGLYTVLSQSPRRANNATAIDSSVPIERHRTTTANEADDADMKAAALREASKAIADALTIPFPVNSWYSDDLLQMNLWESNSLVTVVSPTLFIPNGFDFLIRAVEYRFDDDGARATLDLVPPQAYTGKSMELW